MQKHNVTLISTVHKDIGLCNSYELYKIIEAINPDVIFLEALKNRYHQMLFSQFGVNQERLEVKAIQAYCQNNTCEYAPVLDFGLPAEFDELTEIVSKNTEYQKILDHYTFLKTENGFQFLNSKKQIALQEEMRDLENRLIRDKIILQKVKEGIDAYETSMLRNIYSFCREKSFNKAIFMCGAAHRKTITQKIQEFERNEIVKLNWIFYNDTN